MTGRDAYKICMQAAGIWGNWVRPVPFISGGINQIRNDVFLTIANNVCTKEPLSDSAVILDLPSSEGILQGIMLAQLGMRPVPLYNGCNAQEGSMALIDNHNIESALLLMAAKLENINFPDNAPPVFLLDSNRTQRFKMNASVFDKSWDIYPQDMPSGEFFLASGIKNIIVQGQKLNKDLKVILYKYQHLGIKIHFIDIQGRTKEISIKKPLK